VTNFRCYKDSNRIQQYFSAEKRPTLWQALPAIEELQTTWEAKRDNTRFLTYRTAINNRLAKLNKYYSRFDEKPVFILALGMSLFTLLGPGHNLHMTVLHPYFKLNYIKLAWGGPEDQKAEREAGDPFAKNWQDEARRILEDVVCDRPSFTYGA
jgi:hypothetical protein